MKKLFLLIAYLLFHNGFAQDRLYKGHFVKENGDRIDCFLSSIAHSNNPVKFRYKLTEDAPYLVDSIDNVMEIVAGENFKYVRKTLTVDVSKGFLNKNVARNKKLTVFMRVLIEGEVSLFEYLNGDLKKYFYSKDDSNIQQLIYRKFYNDAGALLENNGFRQALFNVLKCASLGADDFSDLKYNRNDLLSVFRRYYQCKGNAFLAYVNTKEFLNIKEIFNFSVAAGINFLHISSNDNTAPGALTIGWKPTLRYGVEIEYNFNVRRNQLSLVINPAYTSYSASKLQGNRFNAIEFRSIELPVGLRVYLSDGEDVKWFVNGFATFNLAVKGLGRIGTISNVFDTSPVGAHLGFGVVYDKLRAEIRYQFPKAYNRTTLARELISTGFMLNLGYKIF
ncbi:MAG: hypothetical protein AAFO69_01410 [Bacteroidota bacterium]